MDIRIETRNLNYSIDQAQILKQVSLAVENRHMVGIIGPNGSGKTTLLRHMYRALPVGRKTVFINSRPIEEYAFSESARTVTVVRQENSSDFDFAVENMVLLGRAPYRKSFESFTAEDVRIAGEALASIGMERFAKRSFNALSGGEKQRVLIARSLAQQADIFLLDEPTNHLDVHYQWSLMKMIRDLNATVLGVFHELNLAAHFCDELYVLESGRIAAHGKPAEVLTKELMARVFRVDTDILPLENGRCHIIFNEAITANNAV